MLQIIRSKGEYGEVAISGDAYERLNSFCYKGLKPSLPHFWSSASLKLELDGTDYQVIILSGSTTHCLRKSGGEPVFSIIIQNIAVLTLAGVHRIQPHGSCQTCSGE